MKNVEIRPIGATEAEDAYRVLRSCFPIPGEYKDVKDNLENPITRALGMYLDWKMIGDGALWMLMEEAHVTHVCVLKEHRGEGLGEGLMRALIQHASDSGARFMELECRRSNESAIRLYHKLGFLRVAFKKNYYPDTNEDAVVFALIALPAPNVENDPFLTAE